MDARQTQIQCWTEARDLLQQIGSREAPKISYQQRTHLYRLAFALVAMGAWIDQHGLPQCATLDPDWVT